MKLDRTPDRLERKGWRDLLWCWLVINNYLPPLSALLAVQRPTSSLPSLPQKKKKKKKKYPQSLASFSYRPFSGICFCERSQNSQQLRFSSRKCDPLGLCLHTYELFQAHCECMEASAHSHYLEKHQVKVPHIKNTAERPHWRGADRRDSFLCAVHQSLQAEW